MKICMPITEDRGLASPLSAHFGSAPAFLLVDSETRAHRVLANAAADHAHGQCSPIAALASEGVEAFVVEGIGGGALRNLLAMGARVYRGCPGTAASGMVEALAGGVLREVTPAETCGHHHHR
jgi:predicted Fe-Mo cluster-binding NifX family protein